MRGSKSFLTAAVLCAASLPYPLAAHDARGTIVGRVTDSSCANMANTNVRATNVAMAVAVTAKTNDAGNYSLPYLNPGFYTVTAESPGRESDCGASDRQLRPEPHPGIARRRLQK